MQSGINIKMDENPYPTVKGSPEAINAAVAFCNAVLGDNLNCDEKEDLFRRFIETPGNEIVIPCAIEIMQLQANAARVIYNEEEEKRRSKGCCSAFWSDASRESYDAQRVLMNFRTWDYRLTSVNKSISVIAMTRSAHK